MFIKKSFISGVVGAVGAIILLAVVILYGFTEIQIPKGVLVIVWFTCVLAVKRIVERSEE